MGPVGMFGYAYVFDLTNPIPVNDNSSSIAATLGMGGVCFSGDELYATYQKNGTYYRGQISECHNQPPLPPDETVPDTNATPVEPICDGFADMFQTRGACPSGGTITFNNGGQIPDGSTNIILQNTDNTLNTCTVTTPTWVSTQFETCGSEGDCSASGSNAASLNITYSNTPNSATISSNPSSSTDNLTLSSNNSYSGSAYNAITTSWHTNIQTTFAIENQLQINSLKMTQGNTFNFGGSDPYLLEIGTLGIENNGASNTLRTDGNAKNIKIGSFELASSTTLDFQASQTIQMNSFSVDRGSTVTLRAPYININTFISDNGGSGQSTIKLYADYIDIGVLTLGQTVTLEIHPYTSGKRVLFRTNTLTESSSSSILLSSGNYYVNTAITIPGTSDVSAMRAIDSAQTINFYINSDLSLGNNPGINAIGNKGNYDTSLPAAHFILFINGDLTTGGGGTTINATIYTAGDVTLGNPTYIKGAVSAQEEISIGQGQFIYDQSFEDSGWGECEEVSINCANPRPYAKVFSTNIPGGIEIIGNSVMCKNNGGTCGNPGTATNNSINMMYANSDSDPSTFNSAAANLALPADSEILWAGLYWQGTLTTDNHGLPTGETFDTMREKSKTVKIQAPSGNYVTLTTTSEKHNWVYIRDSASSSRWYYQGHAEVTDIVQNGGNGYYTVADIVSRTGQPAGGSFGSWSIVILYKNNSVELRNLSVFDGYFGVMNDAGKSRDHAVANDCPTDDASIGVTNLVEAPLSGFKTTKTGTVGADFAIYSGEGDIGITGDQMYISDSSGTYKRIFNGLNPATNVQNSTISKNGVSVTSLLPSPNNTWPNTLGTDIDFFNIDGFLDNEQSSTTMRLNSTGDGYFPGVFAISADLFKPDLCYDYSIKQNGHFYDVDLPSNALPDLDLSVSTGSPLEFTVYLRNREGDIDAVLSSLHTDFNTTTLSGPTQMRYHPDSVSMSVINGNYYYPYSDADPLVEAAGDLSAIRLGVGRNPTDAHNGGSFGNQDSQYIRFSTEPQVGTLSMKFKLYLDFELHFGDGTIISLLDYRLGTDIKRCEPSDNYQPEWGIFTTIDKQLNPIGTQPQQLFYNHRTQVVNRPFEIDVVGLKESTIHLDPTLRTHWEKFETNTTVEVELADMQHLHEFNATCGDSFNALPGTQTFVHFPENNLSTEQKWRVPLPPQVIPYAKSNVAYRIWFLENNETALVEHNCSKPGTGPNCYTHLYANIFAPFDAGVCATQCNGVSEVNCYNCLRGNYGHALCSRDNFSIRPEAFRILDVNDTAGPLTVATIDDNRSIVARYDYEYEINATSYTSDISAPGYTQTFNTDSATLAILQWNDTVNPVTCNDKNDSNISLSFSTEALYSRGLGIGATPNVGRYDLHLKDGSWTNVDKYANAAHHYLLATRDFFQSNKDDCVVGSSDIPLVFPRNMGDGCTSLSPISAPQEVRVGCDIRSDHNKTSDKYCYNEGSGPITQDLSLIKNYVDMKMLAKMHHFTVESNNTTWVDTHYIDNATEIYLYSNFTDTNTLNQNFSMGANYEANVSAVDADDVTLSNFTDGCHARDLNISINLGLNNCAPDLNLTHQIVTRNTNTGTIIENNIGKNNISDVNVSCIAFHAVSFANDMLGSSQIDIALNFERNISVTHNPFMLTFSDLNLTCIQPNDCNVTVDGINKIVSEEIDLNDKNITFIYGRVHAPRYRIEGNEGNATLYYEVHWDGTPECNLSSLLPTPILSVDSVNWYRNDLHNTSEDGNITALQPRNPSYFDESNVANQGDISTGAFEINTEAKFPYKTTIDINASSWLIYNRFDSDATMNRFDIEFTQQGAIGGKGGAARADDGAAAVTNRRITW